MLWGYLGTIRISVMLTHSCDVIKHSMRMGVPR